MAIYILMRMSLKMFKIVYTKEAKKDIDKLSLKKKR